MAKKGVAKKSVKNKTSKKKVAKKPVKKKVTKKNNSPKSMKGGVTKRKINLVTRNFILFAALSIVSYLIYKVSGTVLYETFFYLLAMILGFITVALLISLLVLVFLRILKRT